MAEVDITQQQGPNKIHLVVWCACASCNLIKDCRKLLEGAVVPEVILTQPRERRKRGRKTTWGGGGRAVESLRRRACYLGMSQPGWEELGWENASYCPLYQVILFDWTWLA